MKKKSNIRLVKTAFTEESTKQFLVELDFALKTIDYDQIEKLLVRYNIQHDPECIIFLDDIKHIFQDWKIEEYGSILIGDVETRVTKCFACFLGKNVTAYILYFQHKGLKGYKSRITYVREFAVFIDIKKNCLVDFGVCNGFLSIKEIDELEIK